MDNAPAENDQKGEAVEMGKVIPFRLKKLTGFLPEADTAPSEYVPPEKDPA